MKNKKIISAALALTVMSSGVAPLFSSPVTSFAAINDSSGVTIDDVCYRQDSTYYLLGYLEPEKDYAVVHQLKNSSAKEVTILEKVNGVISGQEAELTVKRINKGAFSGNSSVEKVTLPDTIEKLDEGCFKNCKNLSEINIPKNTVELADYALSLTKLTKVELPAKVEKVGVYILGGCTELTEIDVDKDNPNFESVDGILFNEDKTHIYAYPAAKEGEEYTVPDGVEYVENGTFLMSKNLKTVTLPESVSMIRESAFQLSDSIESIYVKNPNCEFFEDKANIMEKSVTIYAPEGSKAQKYAEKNGVNFVATEFEKTPETTTTTTAATTTSTTKTTTATPAATTTTTAAKTTTATKAATTTKSTAATTNTTKAPTSAATTKTTSATTSKTTTAQTSAATTTSTAAAETFKNVMNESVVGSWDVYKYINSDDGSVLPVDKSVNAASFVFTDDFKCKYIFKDNVNNTTQEFDLFWTADETAAGGKDKVLLYAAPNSKAYSFDLKEKTFTLLNGQANDNLVAHAVKIDDSVFTGSWYCDSYTKTNDDSTSKTFNPEDNECVIIFNKDNTLDFYLLGQNAYSRTTGKWSVNGCALVYSYDESPEKSITAYYNPEDESISFYIDAEKTKYHLKRGGNIDYALTTTATTATTSNATTTTTTAATTAKTTAKSTAATTNTTKAASSTASTTKATAANTTTTATKASATTSKTTASSTAASTTTAAATTTKTADTRIVGTWDIKDYISKGQSQNIKSTDKFTLVFNDDLTGTAYTNMIDKTDIKASFKWTSDGKNVKITVDNSGEVKDATLQSNGTLRLAYKEGIVIDFEKKTESKVTLGDINGDGLIDATDASQVLSAYAALSTNKKPELTDEQMKAANVNGDENVDASDASAILAYYAHKSTGGKLTFEEFIKDMK